MDDYIQEEILQGFDVSKVLVKRDADYFDWNPAIESKEALRQLLPADQPAVITQFERWWDKYRVSLHELDAQVEQAEAAMKAHLVELGYE